MEQNHMMEMKAWTRRDLTIVPLETENCIVISCDSCGAVGQKPGDVLALPPRYVGKFTARVALTEVMCSGALPVTVSNGVACEMQPTGAEILAGVQDEIKNAGLTDIVVTGSTEENFNTNMTALAVTVIGSAKERDLRFGKAAKGDKLILFGIPRVGSEVDLNSAGFYDEIRQLLSIPLVKEIVPVGSKGVQYEADMLAQLNAVNFKLYDSGIDYLKSAGPATCLLVLCENPAVEKVLAYYETALVIGEIG